MDISEIPGGLWVTLLQRWQRGKTIDQRDIDRAFAEEGDIPECAVPFIQALVNGEVKLKRGVKSDWPDWAWRIMLVGVELLRRDIAHYRRTGEIKDADETPDRAREIERLGSCHGSPLVLALESTADQFEGVTYPALEKRRKKQGLKP